MKRMMLAFVVAVAFGALLLGVAWGQGDVTPPTVVDISVRPSEIDTDSGAQVITVTARITDDLSGVHATHVNFRSEQEPYQYAVAGFDGQGGRDESYVGEVQLPQYSRHGRWILFEVKVWDDVDNLAYYFPVEGENSLPPNLYDVGFWNGPTPTPTATSTQIPPAPTATPPIPDGYLPVIIKP